MYIHMFLSIYLSIYLSLYIYLSIYLSLSLSLYIYINILGWLENRLVQNTSFYIKLAELTSNNTHIELCCCNLM